MRPLIDTLVGIWHRYVLRHTITFHPATKPDRVISDSRGKPVIGVFDQVEFAVPVDHFACSCGEIWEA